MYNYLWIKLHVHKCIMHNVILLKLWPLYASNVDNNIIVVYVWQVKLLYSYNIEIFIFELTLLTCL